MSSEYEKSICSVISGTQGYLTSRITSNSPLSGKIETIVQSIIDSRSNSLSGPSSCLVVTAQTNESGQHYKVTMHHTDFSGLHDVELGEWLNGECIKDSEDPTPFPFGTVVKAIIESSPTLPAQSTIDIMASVGAYPRDGFRIIDVYCATGAGAKSELVAGWQAEKKKKELGGENQEGEGMM